MAILFRQTNAVWVAAVGALAVVDHIEFNCRVPLTFTSGLQLLLKDRRAVTHRHLGTITLLALFVSFVLYNKSIVLGEFISLLR